MVLRHNLSLWLFVLALALVLNPVESAESFNVLDSSAQNWSQVVSGGFGDKNNCCVYDCAAYNGYLYVSILASPGSTLYSGSQKVGGEIWRSSDGMKWEQVASPGFGYPENWGMRFVPFQSRLYATTTNPIKGTEVWATSNGKNFTRIASGGFDNASNSDSFPLVFNNTLILLTSNTHGVSIWVSDDGLSFHKVVEDGLGFSGSTGAYSACHEPDYFGGIVFNGILYVSVTNPERGGEIWRTKDGYNWERVASGGLGDPTITTLSVEDVYKDQLYVIGTRSGQLDDLRGLDVFRTSDGTSWEKVVDLGFGLGKERSIAGLILQFKGYLYLVANNMDPRVLVPEEPLERHEPAGFVLYRSSDGENWTQVGREGFGNSNNFMTMATIFNGTMYIGAVNYRDGLEIWKSADGSDWERVFKQNSSSMFHEGGGPLFFNGDLYCSLNDLTRGCEIWRYY